MPGAAVVLAIVSEEWVCIVAHHYNIDFAGSLAAQHVAHGLHGSIVAAGMVVIVWGWEVLN